MRQNQSQSLPLLNLFNYLRENLGWCLGIDDYLAVAEVMTLGVGVGDWEQVQSLCCLLWAKSETQVGVVKKLVGQMRKSSEPQRSATLEKLEPLTPISPDPPAKSEKTSETTAPPTPPPPPASETLELTLEMEMEPAVTAAAKIRRRISEIKGSYRFQSDYFPVTEREMKQTWRLLRRPLRQGVPAELDVPATVAKIAREGILAAPVLVPRRVNQTDLILLIDRRGSMLPFHPLTEQLVQTALRGGRLRATNVYYFHNYPDETLFRHRNLLQGVPLMEVLSGVSSRAVMLIISDGGAARRFYDQERVEATGAVLEVLRSFVQHIAWLNPVPESLWRHTSAEGIARAVPMFALSREELNRGMQVLRGRKLSEEF